MGKKVFANGRELSVSSGSNTQSVSFPDVCKTPAPPAPPIPIPYPVTDYQDNLEMAQQVDALAARGNKGAKKLQKKAVDNLTESAPYSRSMGDEPGTAGGIISATAAVKAGYTLHKGGMGKPVKVKVQGKRLKRTIPFRMRLSGN